MLDRGVKRIRELVDEVLTAARFPSVELRMEQLRVRDLLAEAVQEVEPKAEHKSINVSLDVGQDLAVEGDRRLLHSIAANLIGNAIKFTASGGSVIVKGRRDEGLGGHRVCGRLRGPPSRVARRTVPALRPAWQRSERPRTR